MRGCLTGGFLGIGGASWKTDRKQYLAGQDVLKNVFNYAIPQGEAGFAEGQAGLRKAGDYYSQLLSGNRTAVRQAVAPETAAVQARTDASRRQLATSGTARGGGVASTSQTAKDRAMAEIDQLLFGVRPGAAKGLESVAGRGLSAASNLLGMGADIAQAYTSNAAQSRKTSYELNQDMVGKASQAILNVIGAFA